MIVTVTILAKFDQLKIKHAEQQGRGQGTSVQAAAGAAVRDLLRQKGLKHQRFSEFTATFSIGKIKEEEKTNEGAA